MQFCNTTTQIMAQFYHHTKQDTSIVSISHCIKLIIAVWVLYIKQLKNMTDNLHEKYSTSHSYSRSSTQEIPRLLENLKGDDNYKRLYIKM
jgi:hypothetical protein